MRARLSFYWQFLRGIPAMVKRSALWISRTQGALGVGFAVVVSLLSLVGIPAAISWAGFPPYISLSIILLFVLGGLMEFNFQRFRTVEAIAERRVQDAQAEVAHLREQVRSHERENRSLRDRLASKLEIVYEEGRAPYRRDAFELKAGNVLEFRIGILNDGGSTIRNVRVYAGAGEATETASLQRSSGTVAELRL